MTLLSSKCLRALLVGTWALAGGATQATSLALYSEDFEGAPSGAIFGAFSVNSSGISVNETNDLGHAASYGNNEFSAYDLPLLDLSLSLGAFVEFDFNISTEAGFDGFNVVANGTGGAGVWQLLPVISGIAYAPVSVLGSLGTGGFALGAAGVQAGTAVLDLSGFGGLSAVAIRIQFASDPSFTAAGVAIDNLRVVPEPTGPVLLACGLVALAARKAPALETFGRRG